MQQVVLLEKKESVSSPQNVVFNDLINPKKYSSFFDNTFLKTFENEPVPVHFQFVATISECKEFSRIQGKINSVKEDESFQELNFEWNLTKSKTNGTNLSYKIYDNNEPHIKIPVNGYRRAARISAFVGLTVVSFAAIPSAYATTATVISSATIATPMVSKIITVSGTAAKSTAISKTLLAVITMSIVTVAGGVSVMSDAYYSDPYIEYSLYPTQLPAELHGVSLQIKNVYSTDDKSKIVNYDCNDEPIIRGLDYTFDCITENSLGNKETVTTVISVKEPVNLLGADATECVSQHYMLNNDVTQDYPYLLDLPHTSPTDLANQKQTHKKLMDDYYENHDYVSAKKHATIVLKYFDANEVQTLSTMGNIIRDENRSDLSGTQCAIVIHSTSHLYSTVWGKLALAEDYHVLGNYDESIRLSSLVIDDYENNDSSISQISYANALTIKANALYRQALNEQSTLDDAKMYYTMAHDIRKSYDTWFGLGNIDKHEGNFADALEKYEQAKLLVEDTDEVYKAIDSIPFISNKI